MGLLRGESCMILTSTVFDWSTRVTDGRTDGRLAILVATSLRLGQQYYMAICYPLLVSNWS